MDAYLPTVTTPSICISLEKTTFEYSREYAVRCKGFSRTPNALALQEYGYQGVDMEYMNRLADMERRGLMGGLDPETSSTMFRAGSR